MFQKMKLYQQLFWVMIKYQIITKSIFSIFVFPLYFYLSNILIRRSGRVSISSGDFITFIFSTNGLFLLLLTLFLMLLLVGVDMNSFIILTKKIQEKETITMKNLLKITIQSIRYLFSVKAILMIGYIAVIFPIIGIGITISPMRDFQIPNFITAVIYKNPLYLTFYLIIILILLFLSFRYIFALHFMILEKVSVLQALQYSKKLMKENWKTFIKQFIFKAIVFPLLFVVIVVAVVIGVVAMIHPYLSRFTLLLTLLPLVALLSMVSFISMPYIIFQLSILYFQFTKQSFELEIQHHKKKKSFFAVIVLLFVVGHLLVAYSLSIHFDAVFKDQATIEVIAHRGGGDLGAENTLEGIENAIKEKAHWTEIDVQRTKDGQYVIYHDATLKRLSGSNEKIASLTFEEVQKQYVKNTFDPSKPAQKIPTLEQVLTFSKGRIGVFVELKGKTADSQMVDDVVKMIKSYHMERETVLLSLDYALIQYIENKYPELDTGYLYYFSFGKTSELLGDYLIMEENQATVENIANIQAKGKKVVVWTVNLEDSIQKFTNSKVDGIISDVIVQVNQALKNRAKLSDFEIIMQSIFE